MNPGISDADAGATCIDFQISMQMPIRSASLSLNSKQTPERSASNLTLSCRSPGHRLRVGGFHVGILVFHAEVATTRMDLVSFYLERGEVCQFTKELESKIHYDKMPHPDYSGFVTSVYQSFAWESVLSETAD
jgi:hypothetical protein